LSKITNDGLTRSGTKCFIGYSCCHVAYVTLPYGNIGRQRVNPFCRRVGNYNASCRDGAPSPRTQTSILT